MSQHSNAAAEEGIWVQVNVRLYKEGVSLSGYLAAIHAFLGVVWSSLVLKLVAKMEHIASLYIFIV